VSLTAIVKLFLKGLAGAAIIALRGFGFLVAKIAEKNMAQTAVTFTTANVRSQSQSVNMVEVSQDCQFIDD
jgi:hypothetical protein